MELINDPKTMQARSSQLKKDGQKIIFVPTMGGLHQGHLSLVKRGKDLGRIVVMSIYLNPTQFASGEDLSTYPTALEEDLEKAKNAGVNIIFCPTDKSMYPENFQTSVDTNEISKGLCGKKRPEHFRGVTTIVLKLFNIVKPDIAIFGEKDYQQLKVIKKMVEDLNVDVEIFGAPIVREEDGLAMSTRNSYLDPTERMAARSVNESLQRAKSAVQNGEKNIDKIISDIKLHIESTGVGKIDYIKICDPDSLKELSSLKPPAILAVAAHFGKARLIDNCILDK